MTEILDREEAKAPDQQLVALHQTLGGLTTEASAMEDALAALDKEDADKFAEDGPGAEQRQRQRLATEAALHQLRNRIDGARAAIEKREGVLVADFVALTLSQMNADIDAMQEQVQIASAALTKACTALGIISRRGIHIVQRYRKVRGRSTLTDEGHIAGGMITSLGDPENLQMTVERHLGCHLWWRTQHGAHAVEIEHTLGGQLETMRGVLETLLGSPEFRDRELPALRCKAIGVEQ